MRVVWIGTNDEDGHVRHHHELRLHMRKEYGVELAGPGYTWNIGKKGVPLSTVAGKADVVVLDARGCSPLHLICDAIPDAYRVLIERDFHNKPQWSTVKKFKPHAMLGAVARASPPDDMDPWKQKGTHVKYDPWIDDDRDVDQIMNWIDRIHRSA